MSPRNPKARLVSGLSPGGPRKQLLPVLLNFPWLIKSDCFYFIGFGFLKNRPEAKVICSHPSSPASLGGPFGPDPLGLVLAPLPSSQYRGMLLCHRVFVWYQTGLLCRTVQTEEAFLGSAATSVAGTARCQHCGCHICTHPCCLPGN